MNAKERSSCSFFFFLCHEFSVLVHWFWFYLIVFVHHQYSHDRYADVAVVFLSVLFLAFGLAPSHEVVLVLLSGLILLVELLQTVTDVRLLYSLISPVLLDIIPTQGWARFLRREFRSSVAVCNVLLLTPTASTYAFIHKAAVTYILLRKNMCSSFLFALVQNVLL